MLLCYEAKNALECSTQGVVLLIREHVIEPEKLAKSSICAVVAAAMCISFSFPTSAIAVTASEKQAEADAALSSLNAMQAKLDESQESYRSAMAEQISAQERMEEAQNRIDEANEHIDELQDQLAVRARSMYRTGSSTFIDLLLGSASFHDLTTNWDILNDMNQKDADMVEETKNLREEVEEEKSVYAEKEKVAAQKTEEMLKLVEESTNLFNEQQALYNSLSAEAQAMFDAEQAAAQQPDPTPSGNNGGGTEPPYVASTGNAIVDRGLSYVGNAQYASGACSPGVFDCSGFVSYCLTGSYSRLGWTGSFLASWPQVSDPQPGDVCCNMNHCGIYIGGGQMVHCADYGIGVTTGPVQGGMVYLRPF